MFQFHTLILTLSVHLQAPTYVVHPQGMMWINIMVFARRGWRVIVDLCWMGSCRTRSQVHICLD